MQSELIALIIKTLKESKISLSPVELFNFFVVKNLVSNSIRNDLEIRHIRRICNSLVKEGILVENELGRFAYNSNYKADTKTIIVPPSPISKPAINESTPLEMMREYVKYKTNKDLEPLQVLEYYAKAKSKEEIEIIMDDFMDYFKIEKNEENLEKWGRQFSNAFLICGITVEWG